MGKESKISRLEQQEFALGFLHDSLKGYFLAESRGFVTPNEEVLMRREVEIALSVVNKLNVDPFYIIEATVSAIPTPLKENYLNICAKAYKLSEAAIGDLRDKLLGPQIP
jgi:hypothetical protein